MLLFLFSVALEFLLNAITQEKEMKQIEIGKQQLKLFCVHQQHECLHRITNGIYKI